MNVATCDYETLTNHNNIDVPQHLRLQMYNKYDVLALAINFAYDCNFGCSQKMRDFADIMYNTEIEQGMNKDPSYETLCKAYVDVYCIHKAKHRLVNE